MCKRDWKLHRAERGHKATESLENRRDFQKNPWEFGTVSPPHTHTTSHPFCAGKALEIHLDLFSATGAYWEAPKAPRVGGGDVCVTVIRFGSSQGQRSPNPARGDPQHKKNG